MSTHIIFKKVESLLIHIINWIFAHFTTFSIVRACIMHISFLSAWAGDSDTGYIVQIYIMSRGLCGCTNQVEAGP